MPTECSQSELDLGRSGGRKLVGAFDGGAITSNGGVVLLAAADNRIGLADRLARCFKDLRLAEAVTHAVPDLLRQRIFAIALGHEDLIDHDALRDDPALAAVLDKPGGRLAGKSTLNRLEHADKIKSDSRHHKLDHDTSAIEGLFVDLFLDAHDKPPVRIVLDLDATDDPVYGAQEGRHFHGYYDCYCYLPLYIFCGRHLLAAKLRTSSVDAADDARDEVARIVAKIRARWPTTTIVIRADSGFCRDDLMAWCEANDVQYVLGLAGNSRLVRKLSPEMRKARRKAKRTNQPARVFADFAYRTRKSWSTKRRVIGKAEWTHHAEGVSSTRSGANPRFIVTNVHAANGDARFLYEDVYCQRGEMENRLKECQGDLFADRTPAPTSCSARILRDARQPAAPVVRIVRLRADVRGAPHRSRRHQTRSGDVRHDPPEAVEDRRAGDDQRAARKTRVRLGLSGTRGVRAGGAATIASAAAAAHRTQPPITEDHRRDRTSCPTGGMEPLAPHTAAPP